jgi:hypothetical protein
VHVLDGFPSRLAYAGGTAGPLVAGLFWGFLPCGMVFGALFYAMATGSALGGAMLMAGFRNRHRSGRRRDGFSASRRCAVSAGARPSAIAAGLALMLVAAGRHVRGRRPRGLRFCLP